ncbi:hypothetical protein LJ739_00965 [Aestuariibacter halophilus]|uniref:Prepilin-type N-terminal cleavage/methylation domain-containing protein n=1 Tax=Fluctibacter halophilus TaxID=226011 RepID=A0ABS8G2J9_9ALTE|nr:hypothetical protein [Aestuariibacter halophilus]MCC2614807.1 hypothetical protein [Aestuariibacter halophilus]
MMRKMAGFSLIEALVAGLIMFIALTVFTNVYRGALQANQRATEVVWQTAPLDLLFDAIHLKLTQAQYADTQRGEEYFLGRRYLWEAKVSRRITPPERYLNKEKVETGGQAVVWKVSLHDASSDDVHEYMEITW